MPNANDAREAFILQGFPGVGRFRYYHACSKRGTILTVSIVKRPFKVYLNCPGNYLLKRYRLYPLALLDKQCVGR